MNTLRLDKGHTIQVVNLMCCCESGQIGHKKQVEEEFDGGCVGAAVETRLRSSLVDRAYDP